MSKGSRELTNARKDEIMSACKSLYETIGFRNITIKDIAEETSLTRTSIYNYFETKEEIFLVILQEEYELWVRDLDALTKGHETMDRDEVARALAGSIDKRVLLLKLLSMNLYDMEENSRMERLVEFKQAYGASIKAVDRMIGKFCPDMTDRERQNFLYSFFPFIYGIYPYTVITEKQKMAMEQADVGFIYLSIYEMTYNGTSKLLGLAQDGYKNEKEITN